MACFPASCQELTCRDAPPRVPDFPEFSGPATTIEPTATTGSMPPSEFPTGADDMTGSPSPSSETPIIDSTGPLTGPTTGPGTGPTTGPGTGPGFTPGDPGSSIPPSGSTTGLSTSDNTEVVTELASLSPTTEGVVATTTATSDLATSPGMADTVSPTPQPVNLGLVISLSICGSIIIIVLLAVGIWCLWKNKKACFDTGNKSDSQTALAASGEKDVELIKIRQGAVVLQPRPDGGEVEENQDKPPAAEVQPSNPVISTSEPANNMKKKKRIRQNRVTPEPLDPPVQTAELPPVQTAETHSHEA